MNYTNKTKDIVGAIIIGIIGIVIIVAVVTTLV